MLFLAVLAMTAIPVHAESEIHGFAQVQAVAEDSNYSYQISRFGLRATEKFDDEFDVLAEIYIHPTTNVVQGRLYMESAYINWHLAERLPWDFHLRIGKGRNICYGQAPFYSRRRTSDYSLYSEAFTQLRVLGVQSTSNFGPVTVNLGLINPYNDAGRRVPDFPIGDSVTLPHSDRDNDMAAIQRAAGVGRIGYSNEIFNVGASAYVSETEAADDNEYTRFGVDGEAKFADAFLVQGQFTAAQTMGLDHNGFEVLGGYEQGKLGCYARYGMLTYDDDTLMDVDQIMLSVIYKIRPRIHYRLEALINGEDTKDTGADEVDNNRLFAEILFAF